MARQLSRNTRRTLACGYLLRIDCSLLFLPIDSNLFQAIHLAGSYCANELLLSFQSRLQFQHPFPSNSLILRIYLFVIYLRLELPNSTSFMTLQEADVGAGGWWERAHKTNSKRRNSHGPYIISKLLIHWKNLSLKKSSTLCNTRG